MSHDKMYFKLLKSFIKNCFKFFFKLLNSIKNDSVIVIYVKKKGPLKVQI